MQHATEVDRRVELAPQVGAAEARPGSPHRGRNGFYVGDLVGHVIEHGHGWSVAAEPRCEQLGVGEREQLDRPLALAEVDAEEVELRSLEAAHHRHAEGDGELSDRGLQVARQIANVMQPAEHRA